MAGIEAVVHLLDNALADRGHEVSLLASGGSRSRGRLLPLSDAAIAAEGRDVDLARAALKKEEAARRAAELVSGLGADVVLNHSWRSIDHLDRAPCPVLTTVHHPLDTDPYRSRCL